MTLVTTCKWQKSRFLKRFWNQNIDRKSLSDKKGRCFCWLSTIICLIFKYFWGVLLGHFWTYFDRFVIFFYFPETFHPFFCHFLPFSTIFFKFSTTQKLAEKWAEFWQNDPPCFRANFLENKTSFEIFEAIKYL